MSKTIYLYVHGDDYSALSFEQKFKPKEFYDQMVSEGVTKKVIDDDNMYAEIEIKKFGFVDEEFESFVLHTLYDYDDSKHANIYKVS